MHWGETSRHDIVYQTLYLQTVLILLVTVHVMHSFKKGRLYGYRLTRLVLWNWLLKPTWTGSVVILHRIHGQSNLAVVASGLYDSVASCMNNHIILMFLQDFQWFEFLNSFELHMFYLRARYLKLFMELFCLHQFQVNAWNEVSKCSRFEGCLP